MTPPCGQTSPRALAAIPPAREIQRGVVRLVATYDVVARRLLHELSPRRTIVGEAPVLPMEAPVVWIELLCPLPVCPRQVFIALLEEVDTQLERRLGERFVGGTTPDLCCDL